MTRAAWLASAGGALCASAVGVSLPGGGPRSLVGVPPRHHFGKPGRSYTPAELQAELDWLGETLRAVGVRPFAYTEEAAFADRFRSARERLDRPMRAGAFYLNVARLFATLNDGHVSVLPGAELGDFIFKDAGRVFPLVLRVARDGLFVERSHDERFPSGSRIVAIENEDAGAFRAALISLTGGQSRSLRLAFAGNRALEYCFVRFGKRKAFKVEAIDPHGRAVMGNVEAISYGAYRALADAAPNGAMTPYTFSRLASGRIGLISYDECVDGSRFRDFLQATFSSIRAHPIDGLIIDIRRNGGGSSSLNDDLWSYAQGRPFTQSGTMSVRSCERIKREYGLLRYMNIYETAWFASDGAIVTYGTGGLVRPGSNPLRYSGPVYLLIGPATFSSALLCAVAAKDFGLATIVGEETGEPVNSTGEVYPGFSPHIGLQFGFTTKFFTGPKPRPDRQGVVPDVTIVPTAEDLRAGRDPVLDYAMRRILHG